jgi:tRNA(fMet)-specific endonuclease VapC
VKFLLDSNVVIGLLRVRAKLVQRTLEHYAGDVAISSIVAHELYFGAYKGTRQAVNLAEIDALPFAVLDFDREDARRAGEIRATLASKGRSIGPYDVLIAGQASAKGLTLVTRNVREFERVEGLAVENWED